MTIDRENENVDWFKEGIKRVIGSGKKCKFWSEPWLGDVPFYSSFSRLYSIATDKDSCVFDKGELIDGQWVWKWQWRRRLFSWEEDQLETLIQMVKDFKPDDNKDDSWKWIRDEKGKYSVKSAYTFLVTNGIEDHGAFLNDVWNISAPLKIKAFGWRLLQNRIPTVDNLLRRGINFDNGAELCVFCGVQNEDVNHLFGKCNISYQVWMIILNWLGVEAVIDGDVVRNFLQFSGMANKHKHSQLWNTIWMFVMWQIWRERNKIRFEGGRVNGDQIIDAIKVGSWSWYKTHNRSFSFSFIDWANSPLLCV